MVANVNTVVIYCSNKMLEHASAVVYYSGIMYNIGPRCLQEMVHFVFQLLFRFYLLK
jgi:hypothetical protein